MFKNITAFAQAMKNLAQLGPQIKAMQERLEVARVYGSSTDPIGSVHVEMSGVGVVIHVSVSSTLLSSEHQPLLERLTKEAMNEANRLAREMHIHSLRDVTGGAELIPGFDDMLKTMAG
jgi:DNA-binding protein YbaB